MNLEQGAASFVVTLRDGSIEVTHGEDGDVLANLKQAPAGTWDHILRNLKALGFEGCAVKNFPPQTHPDIVPEMLDALESFAEQFGIALDADDDLNGGDAVESLGRIWPDIKAIIAKARRGQA